MSIIQNGILRLLYQEAVEGTGHQPSRFWQHYFQQQFADTGVYSVTMELSPDESRRLADLVVRQYDTNYRSAVIALMWMHCKRTGDSLQEVERQARDAARRYTQEKNTSCIYAMTTVGVSFRMWILRQGEEELTPLHGQKGFADQTQYIDADSPDGYILPQCLGLVKREPPLVDAPVLSS